MHRYHSRTAGLLGTLLIFVLFIVIGLTVMLLCRNSLRLYEILGPPASEDFRRFWAAAHLFVSGKNVYDLMLLSEFSSLHGAGEIAPLPFYYPFFTFTALVPLAFLNFETARASFLIGFLVLYFSNWLLPPLQKVLVSVKNKNSCLEDLLGFSVFFSFFPFLFFWWDGPLTLFPFVSLLLFFSIEQRKQKGNRRLNFAQGLALSLALVKPSVCFLVLSFLVCFWLRTKAWNCLVGLVFGFVLLVVPAALLLGNTQAILSWGQGGPNPLLWLTPTTSAFFQTYLNLDSYFRLLLPVVAVLYSIWRSLVINNPMNLYEEVVLVMIPLSLVTAPYAWTYDFVLLLLPINFILAHNSNFSEHGAKSLRVSSGVLLLMYNLLLGATPQAMALHWWYPLAIFLVALRTRICATLVASESSLSQKLPE